MSPRVLVLGINYAPEPTGIAPYTAGLARGLSERGHNVRVLTTYPHYPEWRVADGWTGLTRREERDGILVTRVRHYVPARPTGIRRAASELSFGARAVSRAWGRPDVVVCPSPALLGTATALLRARTGWRRPALGVVVQDLYSAGITETAGGGGAVTRMLTAIERRTLRSADGVAAIHSRFKSRIVDTLDVDADSVTVIRNWTHVAGAGKFDRAAFRAAQGWDPDEFVVLHTGAMGEKQALGNVVEAARLAGGRDTGSARVRFVLGGDGGQRTRLEEQARGVESVQFARSVPGDAYARLLASADVLLVNERPGVAEMAVPSKLTSYFSSGVPVLAATGADSTTAEELAAAGAGIRVEPGDPRTLLNGVLALAADPSLTGRLGASGPVYCATVLSEGASLDAYAAWVERLAGKTATRETT